MGEIVENVLCTYIAMNKFFRPAILYRAITSAFWFVSPILPKVSWIVSAFVEISVPVVLYIYIRYLQKVRQLPDVSSSMSEDRCSLLVGINTFVR